MSGPVFFSLASLANRLMQFASFCSFFADFSCIFLTERLWISLGCCLARISADRNALLSPTEFSSAGNEITASESIQPV